MGTVSFTIRVMIGQAAFGDQRGLLEGLPRPDAKLELSLSSSVVVTDQTGRDCGGHWLATGTCCDSEEMVECPQR